MGALGGMALCGLMVHGGYELVSTEVTKPTPRLTRTEMVVQAGDSPLNRFSITRVSPRGYRAKPPLILLSPFMLPGAFYEVSETPSYEGSLAGKLAKQRDVWLVDHRRTGLQPGECESGAHDCSVMGEWDVDAAVSDALLATSLARMFVPTRKPVVGGFSAGSSAALALVNHAPKRFSGVFLYEGTLYTEQPEIIEHNTEACAALRDGVNDGVVADPSLALFGPLIALAAQDPNGPSPLGVFPDGTTNQQAFLGVFSSPPPPGALSPTPNFVRMIADFSTEQLVYSNQDRLAAVGPMFDSYGALPALRDLACGLAGEEDSHVDNLAAFKGDVMVALGGTGFAQAMLDTAGLFSNASSLTISEWPEQGEADPYFHHDWQQVFYAPLRDWLHHVR